MRSVAVRAARLAACGAARPFASAAPKVRPVEILNLKPAEVVKLLDEYVIGQAKAKVSVAVALRNRWRRKQLLDDSTTRELADDVVPKNILMIGPTGVGKSEIARRLAKLADAPFIRVEATAYTEVGFHGKDVDTIIQDLLEVAIGNERQARRRAAENATANDGALEDALLDALLGAQFKDAEGREAFRTLLRSGALENREVTIDVPAPSSPAPGSGRRRADPSPEEMVVHVFRLFGEEGEKAKGTSRKVKISEARKLLQSAAVKDSDVVEAAIHAVEQYGIVVIDEIDKICRTRDGVYFSGGDASSEGVQRDLLPIIEGTTVSTKHGDVNTTKILFIACGAFHSSKPSDLMAELQGRLPVRVELAPLSVDDLVRILTETKNNLLQQQVALLQTEGIECVVQPAAARRMAAVAHELNQTVRNIGARRLHAIIEKVFEDLSYGCEPGCIAIDEAFVTARLAPLLEKADLRKSLL